jgi:LacI family transcriptional regulator/LacI family asc operon transcriptional repressor
MSTGRDFMNIYDIARLAGVSIATVSRVINGKGYVNKNTREKVLKVITRHNYTPKKSAQNLSTGASLKLIGIVCYNIEDPYYAKAVAVLQRDLNRFGYDIILSCTGESRKQRQSCIDMLISKNVDAIVFIGSVFAGKSEQVILNAARHLPVFIINAKVEGKNIHCAYCDESDTVYECARALFERGRRKLAFFYDVETYGSSKKREGCLRAVKDLGISEKYVMKCPPDLEGACREFEQFWEEGKADGAMCSNDELAAGILKAARKMGISVPGQLSVIGYNNSLIARCTSPALSSLENNVEKLAEFTAKNISDYFSENQAVLDFKADFKLIIRETL